jgi:cytosine permease
MVSVGIGLPAIALLILGAWVDASACLYSGSLSLTNEVKRFRLPWVTVCSAAIGCVFAICHAERLFMPFLALLGVAFPPVAAVNILHTLWATLRPRPTSVAVQVPVRWAGVLAWITGSVSGYFTSHGYFTVTHIASIDSILIASVVWVLATLVTKDPA